VFRKLDLRKGYYQIPVQPADVPKMAIIMPFSLWEFKRMPFGLKNAGQSSQRLMDWVGVGLDFVFIYMGDILVASADEQSHLSRLQQLLERLREYGLVLNVEKCQFGRSEVDFLGHCISAQRVEPLSSHLSAIQDFSKPADIKALQSLLGLVNFYHRFIPGAARILLPLTNALRGGKRGKLVWSAEMAMAFTQTKAAVCQATRLSHPDPQAGCRRLWVSHGGRLAAR
jgi:hypothetical protein